MMSPTGHRVGAFGVMPALVFGFMSLAATSAAQACEGPPGPNRLIIDVQGVRTARGLMTASLYPGDKSQFLVKDGALKVWRTAAVAPATVMCIYLKSAGAYAVAIYQDQNSNRRWDHALLGHIEPFGFSNNPPILFSRPSFESVRFVAREGVTTIHVRLNHR